MTSLAPLLDAAPLVQFHAGAAMLSLALGPVALYRRRRDRLHKAAGYAWITAMAATSLSSFGLHSIRWVGPFGPIHVLSVVTLVALVLGLRAAIRRDIRRHRAIMQKLWYSGLLLAAIFTLSPGRVMNRVLVGGDTEAGVLLIGALLLSGGMAWVLSRRKGLRRNA